MYESFGSGYHKPVLRSNSHSKFTHIAQLDGHSCVRQQWFRCKHIYGGVSEREKEGKKRPSRRKYRSVSLV